jgi:hypothetical protein
VSDSNEQAALRKRNLTAMWRLKAFEFLGSACECCGETDEAFLTIDHINGNGQAHRNRRKQAAYTYYKKIAMGDWREVQVLCWNCNMAKERPGGCPHQRVQVAQ